MAAYFVPAPVAPGGRPARLLWPCGTFGMRAQLLSWPPVPASPSGGAGCHWPSRNCASNASSGEKSSQCKKGFVTPKPETAVMGSYLLLHALVVQATVGKGGKRALDIFIMM